MHAGSQISVEQRSIDGSALLGLKQLRVLRITFWHIYLTPQAACSGGSGTAELALTKLHTSAWRHERHPVLLDAAIRGGDIYDYAHMELI